MISLKRHTSEFEKIYFDKMWKRIEKKLKHSIKEFSKVFPDAKNEEGVNMDFFRNLFLMHPEELRKRYDCVEYYFVLTKVCYTDLQERLKGTCPISEYKEKRLSVFNEINTNIEIKKATTTYLAKKHIEQIDVCKSDREWKKYIADVSGKYLELYGSVKEIFNYNADLDSEMKAELVKDLGVCVCPYCNRQYINVFFEENKSRTVADIDHFFPKDIYGLWADSLYNMIPSCKVCNMLFKGKRTIDMLNPFQRGYEDDAYFTLDNEGKMTIGELMGWSDDIKIVLKIDGSNKEVNRMISEESKVFRIEEMYRIHSEYVKNLLYKQAMIEKTIANEMVDVINRHVEDNAFTLDELEKVLYGIDVESVDFNKVPLSKLTYDILKRKVG